MWPGDHVSRGPRRRLPALPLLGLLLATTASAQETSTPVHRVRVVDPFDIKTTRHDSDSGDDEGEERWRLRCDATHSVEVRVSVSISPAGGSSGWRIATQEVTLQGPGELPSRPFLSRDRADGEDALPAFDLECHGRTVHLMSGETSLGIDTKAEENATTLALDPALPEQLKRWLSEPARGRVAEAWRLRALLRLLELRTDAETWAMAELHVRREAFAAGDWRGLGIEEPLRNPDRLSPELKERFQRFEQEVREARARTKPLHAVEPRRIGSLANKGTGVRLPPMGDTTLFWRGQAVCAAQTDTENIMRCYDTAKGQWGKREPLSEPEFTGDLRWAPEGTGRLCGEVLCLESDMKPVSTTRHGYLARKGSQWVELRGEGKPRPLSPEALRAELSRGPGSSVLGGGQYRLGARDSFSPTDGKDLRSWFLFDAPPPEPKGGQWHAVLASPDQSSVAAVSCGEAKESPCLLWVARVTPVTPSPTPTTP